MWGIPVRYARRRSRSNTANPSAWLQNRLRRGSDRLDRSAAKPEFAREATLSLVVRHVAVHVETSGRAVSPALRRVGVHRDAERLDFSDLLPADLAGDGSDPALHADLDRDRSLAAGIRLYVDEPETSALLLRAVFGD